MTKNHIYSDKFTSILNNLFHGVMLINMKGVVLEFNKSSLLLLNTSSKKLTNSRLVDVIPKKYRTEFEAYFKNCFDVETKNYGKYEIVVKHKDAYKILEIDCNQNFYSDEDHELYTICVINDISKRKKLEKELDKQKKSKELIQEKLEREQELNDMKTRFISIASHEFRTPLAGILSSVDLVERYLNADEKLWNRFIHQNKVDSHITKIKSSIKMLTTILNQFLSLGQLEEGKIEYQEELFNLQEMLNNTIDEFSGLKKENQKIQYTHKGNKTIVCLDRNILRHIMNNLLSNAVKYTPDHKNIYLKSSIHNDCIKISVKDEGMGIPVKDQKNLFRRFFRATNVTNLQGTGLGLNIVAKYVNLMDGKITFKSEENKGTTFTVIFTVDPLEKQNINLKNLVK
ncbi:ATP-binding protein [Wenyingzhuangia sp. IMCC45467]